MVTSQSGAVVARHDYLPFGAEVATGYGGRTSPWGTADSIAQMFTGKERDSETGLDYFGARYVSGAQGRFTSPDGPFNDLDPSDPQSWNLFTYGRNNPLTFVDPTGTTTCDANGDNCHDKVTVDGGSSDSVSYIWQFLQSAGSQAAQTVTSVADATLRFIAAPRDPGCVARAASVGAAAGGMVGGTFGAVGGGVGGAAGGTLVAPWFGTLGGGFAGGSAGLTQGTTYGALAGGALGGAVSFITCSSGTGQGGAGGKGGDYRPKTRGANANDAKPIRDVAREEGVDARRFGKFVEAEKRAEGRGASENYSYDELKALAKAFKVEGR